MSYALESGYVVTNPCQVRGAGSTINRPNKPIATKQQASLILESAPVELKALFAIALWGGLRKGELLELRRKDLTRDESGVYLVSIQRAVIWLPEGVIQVKEPKWASRRNVALPQGLTELITSHLNRMSTIDPEALLFPYEGNCSVHYPNHAINRVWAKIRKSTGYSGSLHSLRSFAGTSYAMTGATLREIMDRLGHNNYKTAMLYQRNSGRELELVSRLEGVQ
jgi:integrase